MFNNTKAFFVNGEMVQQPDGTTYFRSKSCNLEEVIRALGSSNVSFGITVPKNSKHPETERVIVIKEAQPQKAQYQPQQRSAVPLI